MPASRRRNLTKNTINSKNRWVEGNDNLSPLILDYFGNLFKSESGVIEQEVLQAVKPRITLGMNKFLMAPFSMEDMRKALFQIGDMKAPGPDRLHAVFFKRFWHILGEELTNEVLAAINKKKMPKWLEPNKYCSNAKGGECGGNHSI